MFDIIDYVIETNWREVLDLVNFITCGGESSAPFV